MLSLILFRHGKSDWDAPFDLDHDRPVAKRGREAAKCMGKMLRDAGEVPELVVTSSAVRARETLRYAAQAGNWDSEIRVEPVLYDTTPDAVLAWLNTIDTRTERLLLVGHEPTWSMLASELVGGGALRVPTGTMARIEFVNAERWSQVGFGMGQLRWLLPPKLICQ